MKANIFLCVVVHKKFMWMRSLP